MKKNHPGASPKQAMPDAHKGMSPRTRYILLQYSLLALCVIAMILFFLYKFRPTITIIHAQDNCGSVPGGTISHTIRDSDQCINACWGECASLEPKQRYYDSRFELSRTSCHNCTCYCRD